MYFLLSYNDLKNNFGGVVGIKARLENIKEAPAGVAQWIEHQTVK